MNVLTKPSHRKTWIPAALITLAVIALHFYFLFHAGGLWRDEINLANLSHRTLSGMTHDSFPVLMPLLVRGWSVVGFHSDFDLRILAMFIGLAIPAIFWIAAWTTRRSPPLFGLILFGLNSIVIFWGDSVRAYGLGSLLAALFVISMWRFLNKKSLSRAIILAVAAILSVQTLYQNAILVAATIAAGWLICWRRRDGKCALGILTVGLAAAISLLPYLFVIFRLTTDTAPRRAGFLWHLSWNDLRTIAGFPLPQYIYVWIFFVILIIGLAFRPASKKNSDSVRENFKPDNDLTVFTGAVLFATIFAFFAFLLLAKIETQVWYFLPPLAVIAVCFEMNPPPVFSFRKFRTIIFGLIIGTVVIAIPMALRDLKYRLTNIDFIAKQLAQTASPQDFIVVTPWYLGISFDHYFKGPTSWNTQPPLADHSIHRYDAAEKELQNPASLQPVLDQIGKALKSGHRAWVVGWMYLPKFGRPPSLTGQFLVDHAVQITPIPVNPGAPVYDYEKAQLIVFSGWKTNASALTNSANAANFLPLDAKSRNSDQQRVR